LPLRLLFTAPQPFLAPLRLRVSHGCRLPPARIRAVPGALAASREAPLPFAVRSAFRHGPPLPPSPALLQAGLTVIPMAGKTVVAQRAAASPVGVMPAPSARHRFSSGRA